MDDPPSAPVWPMKKIDIFNHVMPTKFFERIGDYKDIGKRMREVPMLYDLDELHRSVRHVRTRGIRLFSNVDGKPLDLPEFEPIFDTTAQYALPLFLQPARCANFPASLTEKKSKFELWWAFGWPYETSVAM